MTKRIVEISQSAASLRMERQQLIIETESRQGVVPLDDIGYLILDHPSIRITHAVLSGLAARGAFVLVSASNHEPNAIMAPLVGHGEHQVRAQAQIAAPTPLLKQLWRQLVIAKIQLQALVLESCGREFKDVLRLAKDVKSGDPNNREAVAAGMMWPRLMGKDFRRDRAGSFPNTFLNYGYAILRAAMARALVSAGLLPVLGVHHHHRNDAFALASDMMEPFRPYVDLTVRQWMDTYQHETELNRDSKEKLLSLLTVRIQMFDASPPLPTAMQKCAASLAQSYLNRSAKLSLPIGLMVDGTEEEEDPW